MTQFPSTFISSMSRFQRFLVKQYVWSASSTTAINRSLFFEGHGYYKQSFQIFLMNLKRSYSKSCESAAVREDYRGAEAEGIKTAGGASEETSTPRSEMIP